MNSTDLPSAARLTRIQSVLEAEPAFKDKLGEKTVKVLKRSGEEIMFSQEVVDVGLALQRDGKDACTSPKPEILRYADQQFNQIVSGEIVEPGSIPTTSPGADRQLPYAIAVYTLLVSALQISECDKQPGHEERREAIDRAAKAYEQLIN